jgi:hypothetical protein
VLADALVWVERGFRPIPLRQKKPIEKGWPDLDAERIRRWVDWPGDGIGIVTGGGLAVVDADTAEALELLPELGLPPTFGYRTRRGAHRWYAVDGPVRNSASVLGPGLDIKGERGQVAIPPSPGREWDESSALPIAAIPASMLLPPDRRSAGAPLRGAPRYDGPPERVSEGGRHDAAVRFAGHLWATGATEEEVEELLFTWNELACVPPLPDEEILSVVRWVRGRPQ